VLGSEGRLRLQQPAVGVVTLASAFAALGYSAGDWTAGPLGLGTRWWVFAALLAVAVGVADHYPVHIQQNAKITMSTVVLFLAAVILPPAVAGLVCLVGFGISESLLRRARGLYWSDIATQVGRLTVGVVAGSLLAHLLFPLEPYGALPLVVAAATMIAADFLTAPLLLTPMSGQRPIVVIRSVVREAALPEGGQYLIGILGAVAARQQLWALTLLALPTAMVYLTSRRNKELQSGTQLLLEHMADTVDLRDPYTGGHSRRVSDYSRGILREMGLEGPDVNLIVVAARLHDLGKIGMPDQVLLKEGKLTDAEWEIMKEHPEKGAELLSRYPDFRRGAAIVRHHHEAWDGTGYPHRLRERDIPLGSRVIAVADSYDAMTSDRPYRKGMAPSRAATILREGRGGQWDGTVVDAFLRSIADQLEEPVAPILRIVGDRDETLAAV